MTITRREFIGLGLGGAAVIGARHPAAAQAGTPFHHGVASGDPLADRVVLWTRVTAAPSARLNVTWEIARDPGFEDICGRGTTTTDASRDHTVHVDAGGLEPGIDHWYRFHALGVASPVGRTHTAPARSVGSVRLGIVNCAEYEFGYFGAYRLLARRDDIDAVIHLGDYIYEFGNSYGPLATPKPGGRAHQPPREVFTLADYRARYAQYRRDPDLQSLHASHPVLAIWDDHEFANDAYRTGAQNHTEGAEGAWVDRTAAARRAWREWLPVRRVDPADPNRIYRRFRFGDLVDLWMLDGRQYRDQQATNALFGYGSADPAINDPNRTLLGDPQERWLHDGLRSSTAAWKVLGNPVMLLPLDVGPELAGALTPLLGNGVPVPAPLSVEDWNGYGHDRRQLLDLLQAKPVRDVVALTGDYHESFAAEIPIDPSTYRVDGNSVAVEFVAPSVTSPGLEETLQAPGINAVFEANLSSGNPWVTYHEGFANGFGVVDFDRARAHFDYWFIADKADPRTQAAVAASWQTRRGTAKLSEAAGPLGPRARTRGRRRGELPPTAVPSR